MSDLKSERQRRSSFSPPVPCSLREIRQRRTPGAAASESKARCRRLGLRREPSAHRELPLCRHALSPLDQGQRICARLQNSVPSAVGGRGLSPEGRICSREKRLVETLRWQFGCNIRVVNKRPNKTPSPPSLSTSSARRLTLKVHACMQPRRTFRSLRGPQQIPHRRASVELRPRRADARGRLERKDV